MLNTATHRRSARRGSLIVLATVSAFVAGGASSAMAATITGTAHDPIYTAGATLSNNLTVTQAPAADPANDEITFHDAAADPITTSVTDCVAAAGDVTCTVPTGSVANVDLLLGDGNDITTIVGVTASVVIDGGDGDDALSGSNVVDASVRMIGGPGNDTFNGGVSTDTVDYQSSAVGVTATINNTADDGPPGENDNIGAGINVIVGGPGNDVISGGAANPDDLQLDGREGNDSVSGGAGDDLILGGLGADDLHGGAGNDATFLAGPNPTDAITVTLDDAANDGIAGENDNVHSDIEAVVTSEGADSLTGGPGADTFVSGAGNDTINTRGGGNDTVACGAGTDTAFVDPGDTVLTPADDPAAGTCESIQFNDPPVPVPDPGPGPGPAPGPSPGPTPGPAPAPIGAPQAPAPLVTTPAPNTPSSTDRPRSARSISVRLSSSRDRRAPYTFRVRGKVNLRQGVSKSAGCRGTVTISVKLGKRTVASRKAGVRRKDCTFSKTITVKSRGKMKLRVRFNGNTSVGARSSSTRNIRAG